MKTNWIELMAGRFDPEEKPTRPSGFSLSVGGKGVVINGYDEKVAMLIHGKDLDNLIMMCNMAKAKL